MARVRPPRRPRLLKGPTFNQIDQGGANPGRGGRGPRPSFNQIDQGGANPGGLNLPSSPAGQIRNPATSAPPQVYAPPVSTSRAAADAAAQRVPQQLLPSPITLENPLDTQIGDKKGEFALAPKIKRPKVAKARPKLNSGLGIFDASLTDEQVRNRTVDDIELKRAFDSLTSTGSEAERQQFRQNLRAGGSTPQQARQVAPSNEQAKRLAEKSVASRLAELRRRNPTNFRKLTREQRYGLLTREAGTGKTHDAASLELRDIKLPDTIKGGYSDGEINAAIASARQHNVERAALAKMGPASEAIFETGYFDKNRTYEEAARDAIRNGDKEMLQQIRLNVKARVMEEIGGSIERDFAALDPDKIEAQPRERTGGQSLVRAAGLTNAPVLGDLVEAVGNVPGNVGRIAEGFFPSLAEMISHPLEVPSMIDQAFDESALGLALSGDFDQAQKAAITNPVDTALTVAGAASVPAYAGIGATKIARLLGSDVTPPNLRPRPGLKASNYVEDRGYYSMHPLVKRMQQRTDRALERSSRANFTIAQVNERRARNGQEPLTYKSAFGRTKEVTPNDPMIYVPGVRAAIRNPLYRIRSVTGEDAAPIKQSQVPDAINVGRGSQRAFKSVAVRRTINLLATGEMLQRAARNIGQQRYDRLIKPHFMARLMPDDEAKAQFRLNEGEADMIPWTVTGDIAPGKVTEGLERQLARFMESRQTDEIKNIPELRNIVDSNIQQMQALVAYAKAHPEIESPDHNLWAAGRLFANGDRELGVRGQNDREADLIGLGLLVEHQAERAKWTIAARNRLDLSYDPTEVASPARRRLTSIREYGKELEREFATRRRKLGKAELRRREEEARTNAERVNRKTPPITETRGPKRGAPLPQSARFAEAVETLGRAQSAEGRAKRTLETAKRRRAEADVSAGRRLAADRRRLLREIPEYDQALAELPGIERRLRRINKQIEEYTTKAPKAAQTALQARRRKVYRNPKRAVSTKVGQLEAEAKVLLDQRESLKARMKGIESQFDDADIYSKALHAQGMKRFGSSGAAGEVRRLEAELREIENPEIKREVRKQLDKAVLSYAKTVGPELALPGIRNLLGRLSHRGGILDAIEEILRQKGGLDAGARRALDAAHRELGPAIERLQEFARRRAMAMRKPELAAEIDNYYRNLTRVTGMQHMLRSDAFPESDKVMMRRALERMEGELDQGARELEALEMELGQRMIDEPEEWGPDAAAPDELDRAGAALQNEGMLKARREIEEEYDGDMPRLVNDAIDEGVTITRYDDYDDVIDKLMQHRAIVNPEENPLLALPSDRSIRNLYFPDKAARDVEILMREHSEEAAAADAVRVAKEAVRKGEIDVNDLRRTTDRVSPGQRLVLLRTRAEAARRKADVDEVRAALKEQKDELRAAMEDVSRETAMGIPARSPRGWVRPGEEHAVPLADAKAAFSAREQEQIAYMQTRLPQDAGVYISGQNPKGRPTLSSKRRTGRAIDSGLAEMNYKAMMGQMGRQEAAISITRMLDETINDFGVGFYKTRQEAQRAASQMSAANPGMGEMVALRPGPLYQPGKHEATSIQRLTGGREIESDERGILAGTFDEALGDGEGDWTLMPRVVVDMMESATKRPDQALATMQAITQSFKLNVLPFSARWHEGNILDNTLRAAAYGLHPGDYRIGGMLMRSIENQYGKLGADFVRLAIMGVGHFGNRTVIDAPPRRGYGRLAEIADKTLQEHPTIDHMWHLYDGARDKSFAFANAYETAFRQAGLGRIARKELPGFMDRWQNGMKIERDLIDSLGNNLVSNPRIRERYFHQINEIFGDYVTRSPVFRTAVTTIAPFGLWLRNALKFALITLPTKHPIKMSIIANMTALSAEEREKLDLEPYLRGSIISGDRLLRTQGATSIGAALDPGAFLTSGFTLGPFGGLAEGFQGRDPFGNPVDPYNQWEMDAGDKFLLGLRNTYEAFFPIARYVRKAREEGGISSPTSNIFAPEVKPGTELPAGETARSIFDISWTRAKPPALAAPESDDWVEPGGEGGWKEPSDGGGGWIDPGSGDGWKEAGLNLRRLKSSFGV